MDWVRIRNILIERYRADETDHRAFALSRKLRGRARSQRRREKHGEKRAAGPQAVPYHNYIQNALAQGIPLIAMDLEWNGKRPVTEIGLAILHNGTVTHHNIKTVNSRNKVSTSYYGDRRFIHGETQEMSSPDAKMWLGELLAQPNLIIGHAFRGDMLQLSRWGFNLPSEIRVVDTAKWWKAVCPPNLRSLDFLAARYGIDFDVKHCAGNDAYVTLQVALRMSEEFGRE